MLTEDDLGEVGLSYAPGKSELREKAAKLLPQFDDLEEKLNISMSNLSSWLLLSSLRCDCCGGWCSGGLQLRFRGAEEDDGGVLLDDVECVAEGEVLSVLIFDVLC